jgi:hypothetical protein
LKDGSIKSVSFIILALLQLMNDMLIKPRVVVGDVNGKLGEIFEKLGTLHSKTKFSLAIIAGNLFADSDAATNDDMEALNKLLDGRINVPLPTYFSLGTNPFPKKVAFKIDSSTGELAPNLYYLGRRATTKTSEGIRIASLGGEYSSQTTSDDFEHSTYSEKDAKLLSETDLADILVTSDWPDGILKGSKVEFVPETQPLNQRCISQLDLALKPRYHFSTSGNVFYEREPFFHTSEEASETFRITRFISLAGLGNPNKEKWIYAFSIDPQNADPSSLPPGATTSPLVTSTQAKKRAALPEQESYRFSSDPNHVPSSRHRKKRRQAGPVAPSECFFCLSNPNLETHLITSIGEFAYMTVAKGPLPLPTTFSALSFPAHMLIIPLNHTPMLSAIPDEEERISTEKEMALFTIALNSMVRKVAPDLGAVSWSVSRPSGVHAHWQWMPVPIELIQKGLVEAAFRVEAENEKYPSFSKSKFDESGHKESSFVVRLWDTQRESNFDENSFKDHQCLVLSIEESFRFDLQFGRRVLAKLLELDARADWRDCGQGQDDEEKDVEAFKETFKDFDFTASSD